MEITEKIKDMWMLKTVLPIDISDHEDGMNEMSNKLDCPRRDELVHGIYVEYLSSSLCAGGVLDCE